MCTEMKHMQLTMVQRFTYHELAIGILSGMTAISAYYLKGIYLATEFVSLDFKHRVNMQGTSRLLSTSSVVTEEHFIKSSSNKPCRNTALIVNI